MISLSVFCLKGERNSSGKDGKKPLVGPSHFSNYGYRTGSVVICRGLLFGRVQYGLSKLFIGRSDENRASGANCRVRSLSAGT